MHKIPTVFELKPNQRLFRPHPLPSGADDDVFDRTRSFSDSYHTTFYPRLVLDVVQRLPTCPSFSRLPVIRVSLYDPVLTISIPAMTWPASPPHRVEPGKATPLSPSPLPFLQPRTLRFASMLPLRLIPYPACLLLLLAGLDVLVTDILYVSKSSQRKCAIRKG